MTSADLNLTIAPERFALTAAGSASANDWQLLTRVCRQERIARFFKHLAEAEHLDISISSADNTVLVRHCFAADHEQHPVQTQRSIVYHLDRSVGLVSVAGKSAGHQTSALLARWLQDQLAFEHEMNCLTAEVVRSYEEVHLLYGLGQTLSGVLNVEAACQLITQAVLAPLSAKQAVINLQSHQARELVILSSSAASGTEAGRPLARAEAILQVNGEPIGTIQLLGKLDALEFSSGDLILLEAVAAVSAHALHNALLYEQARKQADTDALTGTYNYRRLQERLDEELARAQRYPHPLSVVMIDIDNFKLFNDVYGHPVGDYMLRSVAECLQRVVRSTDAVGRYGGDEFMLILPETDSAGAFEVAERVLKEVEAHDFTVEGENLPLAISLGVATFPHDSHTKHELIAHADTALFESKHSGGRTVRMTNSPRQTWLNRMGNTFTVLEGLVQSVDTKDHYTREHSEVVTDAALILAQHLGVSDEAACALRIAGLLHDVGKIGIPDHILKKPGKLTDEEYAIMKQHVQLSELIIKGVPHLNDVLDAVAHHHERYDGKGYPYGKQGAAIPLLGRIMAIADAYSAMRIHRPYRKGLSWAQARAELERGAGSQFDPQLVPLFIAAIDELETANAASSSHAAAPVEAAVE